MDANWITYFDTCQEDKIWPYICQIFDHKNALLYYIWPKYIKATMLYNGLPSKAGPTKRSFE